MDVEIFWLKVGILVLAISAPSIAVGFFDPSMGKKKFATTAVPVIFTAIVRADLLPVSPDWFSFATSTVLSWATGFFAFIFLVNVGAALRSQLSAEADRMRA